MQIDIQARDFWLTPALRNHVERRLGFALSTRYDRISRIWVRLYDVNGPRGGSDKRCHLRIVIPGQADVVIVDTQPNLYAAIDRAAGRVGRAVARRLARLRRKKRSALPIGGMAQALMYQQS